MWPIRIGDAARYRVHAHSPRAENKPAQGAGSTLGQRLRRCPSVESAPCRDVRRPDQESPDGHSANVRSGLYPAAIFPQGQSEVNIGSSWTPFVHAFIDTASFDVPNS